LNRPFESTGEGLPASEQEVNADQAPGAVVARSDSLETAMDEVVEMVIENK